MIKKSQRLLDAELANIVNEAALRAVRAGRKFATQADMEESIEVVIAGYQKKNAILTDKEELAVAYHEIGHALVAALQTHSAPVQKITIIPRTSGALGYTMQVEEGNHYLMTKEEIAIGSISTGASNDIEQAARLARAMITHYGMSEEFDMVALETVTNQYLGGDASLARLSYVRQHHFDYCMHLYSVPDRTVFRRADNSFGYAGFNSFLHPGFYEAFSCFTSTKEIQLKSLKSRCFCFGNSGFSGPGCGG